MAEEADRVAPAKTGIIQEKPARDVKQFTTRDGHCEASVSLLSSSFNESRCGFHELATTRSITRAARLPGLPNLAYNKVFGWLNSARSKVGSRTPCEGKL